jgi:cupin 2 domain-containing protein
MVRWYTSDLFIIPVLSAEASQRNGLQWRRACFKMRGKTESREGEDDVSPDLPVNLLADLPRQLPDEHIATLLAAGNVRIERIVSHGHSSPEGFWYDQQQPEWVMVLKGAARLRFEGDEQPIEMRPGDWLNIPAHRKHRVEWNTPDEPTVWLAVHYGEPS